MQQHKSRIGVTVAVREVQESEGRKNGANIRPKKKPKGKKSSVQQLGAKGVAADTDGSKVRKNGENVRPKKKPKGRKSSVRQFRGKGGGVPKKKRKTQKPLIQ